LIYFLIYLFIEILVTIEFGSYFGGIVTFLEFIGSFFVGMIILQNLQFSMRDNISRVLNREISSNEFISMGLFKAVGAMFLILPGVFTDIIGVLMQFEIIASFFANNFLPKKSNEQKKESQKDENIIDVEIVEDKK
jgi:UPF0716 family protein affecting phage T7 exclusion